MFLQRLSSKVKLSATAEVRQQRLDMCNVCPELSKVTRQCKQCNCFMDVKTVLYNSKCPLEKW